MLTHEEYLRLVVEVNRLRNEIHLFNNEEISEEALDDLKHKITVWESENPDKISPNSPNYVVAGGVAEGFVKFKHERRMLSINDVFSKEELVGWQKRWVDYGIKNEIIADSLVTSKADTGGLDFGDNDTDATRLDLNNIEYVCEPKLDGLSISLHYKDGRLVTAATRGDGWIGEDVTANVMQIDSIPKSISDTRELEVRGEVFITKADFMQLNEAIVSGDKVGKQGKTGATAIFANPRNAASGTIRQLDSRVVAERNLSFVAYGLWVKNSQ